MSIVQIVLEDDPLKYLISLNVGVYLLIPDEISEETETEEIQEAQESSVQKAIARCGWVDEMGKERG